MGIAGLLKYLELTQRLSAVTSLIHQYGALSRQAAILAALEEEAEHTPFERLVELAQLVSDYAGKNLLVFDGGSLFYSFSEMALGYEDSAVVCDVSLLTATVLEWGQSLLDAGVEILVVKDGVQDSAKRKEQVLRREQKVYEALFMRFYGVKKMKEYNSRLNTTRSFFSSPAIDFALNQLGIQVICADAEADPLIAAIAHERGAAAILSNDSDLLIFPLEIDVLFPGAPVPFTTTSATTITKLAPRTSPKVSRTPTETATTETTTASLPITTTPTTVSVDVSAATTTSTAGSTAAPTATTTTTAASDTATTTAVATSTITTASSTVSEATTTPASVVPANPVVEYPALPSKPKAKKGGATAASPSSSKTAPAVTAPATAWSALAKSKGNSAAPASNPAPAVTTTSAATTSATTATTATSGSNAATASNATTTVAASPAVSATSTPPTTSTPVTTAPTAPISAATSTTTTSTVTSPPPGFAPPASATSFAAKAAGSKAAPSSSVAFPALSTTPVTAPATVPASTLTATATFASKLAAASASKAPSAVPAPATPAPAVNATPAPAVTPAATATKPISFAMMAKGAREATGAASTTSTVASTAPISTTTANSSTNSTSQAVVFHTGEASANSINSSATSTSTTASAPAANTVVATTPAPTTSTSTSATTSAASSTTTTDSTTSSTTASATSSTTASTTADTTAPTSSTNSTTASTATSTPTDSATPDEPVSAPYDGPIPNYLQPVYKRGNRLGCAEALGLEPDELIQYAVWAGNDFTIKQFTQLEPKERTPAVFRAFLANELPKLDTARRDLFARECARYKVAASTELRNAFVAKLNRKPYRVPPLMIDAFRANLIVPTVFQLLVHQDYLFPFDSFNWPYLPDANAALRPLRMRLYTFLLGAKKEVLEWGELDSRSVMKPLKNRQFITMGKHAPAKEGNDEEGDEAKESPESTSVGLEECWNGTDSDETRLDALLHIVKTCRTKAVDQIAHKLPQWLPVILALRIMQARWACKLETVQAFLQLALVSPLDKPFSASPDCKTPEQIRAHMHVFHSAYLFVQMAYDACAKPFSKFPAAFQPSSTPASSSSSSPSSDETSLLDSKSASENEGSAETKPSRPVEDDEDMSKHPCREWVLLLLEALELNYQPKSATPVNVFGHKEAAELLLQCPLPFRCKFNWACRNIEKCWRLHVGEVVDIPAPKHKEVTCPCGLVAPLVEPFAGERDWAWCVAEHAAKKRVVEMEKEAAAKALALETERAERKAAEDREAEAAAFAKRLKEQQALEDARKAAIAAEHREKKLAKKAAKSAPQDDVPEEDWMAEGPGKVKKSKPKKK